LLAHRNVCAISGITGSARNDCGVLAGKCASRVSSTGGWLDLERSKRTCPPDQLLEGVAKLAQSEDFIALPGSASQVNAV
jgi:hypothetical protein